MAAVLAGVDVQMLHRFLGLGLVFDPDNGAVFGTNRLAISAGDVQQAAGVLAQVKNQAAHPLSFQVRQRFADLNVAFFVEDGQGDVADLAGRVNHRVLHDFLRDQRRASW